MSLQAHLPGCCGRFRSFMTRDPSLPSVADVQLMFVVSILSLWTRTKLGRVVKRPCGLSLELFM